jgi:hypothetical protein
MVFSSADFYALIPPNNQTVVPGAAIAFPHAVVFGSDIVQEGPTTFGLATTGAYLVTFQVSVNEPGQLVLALNNSELPATAVGRAAGTSQIFGTSLVSATAGDLLELRNPAGNAAALSTTNAAGGNIAVSAHLTILRVR